MENNRLVIKSGRVNRFIYIAILVAMGSVLHGLEDLIPLPNLFIPGAKLGFANIVTLIALDLLGQNEALLVTFLRVILGGLISGNFLNIGFFLALSGGLFAWFGMKLMSKVTESILIISMFGALFHIIGQIFVAYWYIQSTHIFWYLLLLLPFAIFAGFFTGYISSLIVHYIRNS
ncbi:MAG: Gx transporter family protein [Candidatus Atribacteria bacterium]|nr:Gx transporter family protein [Candidatus Atribacteria bacterium]